MPSYLITGVSRGIGYEFLRQYSSDSKNTVIGIVRDKAATEAKILEDADLKGRSNIHVLQADLSDDAALQRAVEATGRITGGTLDYFIGNAAFLSQFDAYDMIGELADRSGEIRKIMSEYFDINVTANIQLINLVLPLILKGQAKKVIVISTGLGDVDFTIKYEITAGPLYSISKAALNMAVAKFSAQYKKDGILFLSLSPGVVNTGGYDKATPEQLQKLGSTVMQQFANYAPHFKGPITPEESVTTVRSLIANASIEKGNGGDYLSHLGTKQWL